MTDDNIIRLTESAPILSEAEIAPAFSEEALALEFVKRHGDEVRYVAMWNRWLIWDGRRWLFDEKRKVFSLARDICREAAARINSASAKSIASAKTRAAVVSLVSDDRKIAATKDQWDADPWLLNTPDRVIDLRTGMGREARPEDYMTKLTAVAPSSAECPLWMTFLDRVTNKDKSLQKYLQRFCGYCLTGITREHAMAFLYGVGRNGKGVFLSTVSGVVGEYHAAAPIEALTATKTDRHPTELAGLMGARMVTAVETEQGQHWAEARLKTLTGGDPIPARFMRQDFFTFIPQFKLMIAGNHKPGLKTVDEAIRGRMNLIPFTVVIPPKQRDQELVEKLKAEWPGILQWMIDGGLEWQKSGLSPPEVVTKATEKYLAAEDTFQLWLDECCVEGKNEWCEAGLLFESWKSYAEARNEHVGSARRFASLLEARGYPSERKTHRGFLGLRVTNQPRPM